MKYYKQNNEVYAYELDGSQDHLIGDKVAMTVAEIELHINPPITLEQAKEAKRNAIRSEFEATSNAPVVVATVSYYGGFDSAIKLDAVKRLSEALGATEVTFYDVANTGHTLSLVDAQNVITAIAGKYQMDFATKQARMVAVDECLTIEEVSNV